MIVGQEPPMRDGALWSSQAIELGESSMRRTLGWVRIVRSNRRQWTIVQQGALRHHIVVHAVAVVACVRLCAYRSIRVRIGRAQ